MKRMSIVCLMVFLLTLVLLPTAHGQDFTKYRGVNVVGSKITASDLQYLGQTWKVNVVRWQVEWGVEGVGGPANTGTPEAYDAWLESALQVLDGLLPVCEKYGIKVLIDLHSTPGGRASTRQNRIFSDAQWQAKFVQTWNKIAFRYSGNKTVWGFDLANEPSECTVASGLLNWQQLATQVARNIRLTDNVHTIVVSAHDNFVNGLVMLDPSIPNVEYTVHMYDPWEFTSQGIPPNVTPLRYPGVVRHTMWDKTKLKIYLQPIADFQKKYGVRILMGEFSAVRWAAGGSAYNYLKDVIDISENNGWDWTYDVFREYNGWSVEHTEDKNNLAPALKTTNREALLRSWFSKNH